MRLKRYVGESVLLLISAPESENIMKLRRTETCDWTSVRLHCLHKVVMLFFLQFLFAIV